MPVTIHPRATWAPYVVGAYHDHAAAPPVPSDSPNGWDPSGGVFIHHRGPDKPIGGDYETEEDCRQDIATVYMEHRLGDFDGDIAYNFLVCQHGNVYQGRGYERGEANAGEDGEPIDGLARNARFYSICALMNLSHLANETLLRAIRDLIRHLREEAPRSAGPRIVPHSRGYATECPGNLTMYAYTGSTIDPSVPWAGRGDIYTYRAQRWVNETYTGLPDYIGVQENGRTG